jgi:quercetin dioxygenase-like cupin family protein
VPDAPVLLQPGEGESTERYTLLADTEQLVLTEFRYDPGQDGPRRHIHRHHADAFYCLEGKLRITLDEEDVVLGPGGFALLPPNVIHAFGNPADEPGRYLNFHAPGCGFGDYLRGDNPDFDQHYDVPPGSGEPTDNAVVLEPGQGEELAMGPGGSVVKAGTDDGMGSLAVLETVVPGAFPGPQLHEHDRMVDSFYVLDGVLTLRAGDTTTELPAGGFACVPPGNPHTFSNTGTEPVRLLNVFAPAGFERYVRELVALAHSGTFGPEEMARIASKYDFRAI